MTSTTVAQLAAELNKPTSLLLEQLAASGVPKRSGADPISESDKQRLLVHLKASHGTNSAERKKIILVKKSTSEIKQADATGRARTIQVEVRKKRTFIQREEETAAPAQPQAAQPVQAVDTAAAEKAAEWARREEEARHQAEQLRRQEEELEQKRKAREAEEAKRIEAEKARMAAEAAAAVAA